MPFLKTEKTDEIEDQAKNDNEIRTRSEAFYFASKSVCQLFYKTLRARGQSFTFDNAAKTAGEMIIKSASDEPNGTKYHIYLGVVKRDYNLDLSVFENAPNFDSIKGQLGKFFLYCEMIFETLKVSIAADYPDALNMKMQVDSKTSTCYIDEDCHYRIGIKIDQVKGQGKSKNAAIASKQKTGKGKK